MLRFNVYRDGKPAEDFQLAGAYAFGQDGVPIVAELAMASSQLMCSKHVAGICGVALLWDAGSAGRYIMATTRLPDRKEPYVLNVELARAQVLKLLQKREDWGLFDYRAAIQLNAEFAEVQDRFIEALKAPDASAASLLADEALSGAVTLGEKIALFHADIFLKRRRASATAITANVGCAIDLLASEEKYRQRIYEAFNFLSVPMPWKLTEPKEREHQHDEIDGWMDWATKVRRQVCAGPLLAFEPGHLPEWVYIWENDYEALRELIYEHIQHVVKRYSNQVRVWNVVSGLHANNPFNLSFEQLMELTRMSCLLVKKFAPKSKIMIELTQPWGEYYARSQKCIPPLLYAEMAVQSGVKFDMFGLQLCMGAPEEGMYVRDLLQTSSLLDEFVAFGMPVHVTACQVPSDVTPDPWDAWEGKKLASDAGHWHAPWSERLQAEWLQAFCRISISKPFVESLCWRDLSDYEGHFLPHGGLCSSDLEPKLGYRELCNFRASLATSARAAAGRAAQTRPSGK